MRVIKFEYGFEGVNGIIKKKYSLYEIPNIATKCDVWNVLPIKYVRQFTGSFINEKELYEGDIVRCYSSDDWHSKFDYLLEIKWCDFDQGSDAYSGTKGWGAFRVNSTEASTGLDHIRESYAGVNFEIIGNIHNNPELLKK